MDCSRFSPALSELTTPSPREGYLSGPGVLSGSTTDYGVVNGATVGVYSSDYDSLYVEFGVASNVTQNYGATTVYALGAARGTIVDEGYLYLYAAATASGTVLNSGGYDYIYGAASGTIVNSGAYEQGEAGALPQRRNRQQRRDAICLFRRRREQYDRQCWWH